MIDNEFTPQPEHPEKTSRSEVDNNISAEDFRELVEKEPSDFKRCLAGIYEQYLSRGEYQRKVLPQEISPKEAILYTETRLLSGKSPDDVKQIIVDMWNRYKQTEESTQSQHAA